MTQLSAVEVLQSKYMPCVTFNLAPKGHCHILSPLSAFAVWVVRNIRSLERALKRPEGRVNRRNIRAQPRGFQRNFSFVYLNKKTR